MDDKVMVTSMVGGTISASALNHRVWNKKGQKLPVSKDILREAIYEPGIEYMFKNGILYIEDMDFKIELGLEAEGTKTPTQIIPMDEKYMTRVLKLMPVSEMKKSIDEMSMVQKQELVDFAVKQNDIQLDRIKIVSDKCGVDVLKAIELNRQKGE
jgi:hypothetical protein